VADDVTMITDPMEARLLAPEAHRVVRVGLIVPTSGTLGMIAPAALNCAALAAAEVNRAGGILGRRVELVVIDGGGPPSAVAAGVAGLVRDAAVTALVGTHASDVRVATTRAVGGWCRTSTRRRTRVASARRGCSCSARPRTGSCARCSTGW